MIYYRIGNKEIKIFGENFEDVLRLKGFEPFRIGEPIYDAFPIEINSDFNDFSEDDLLYSLAAEGVNYIFCKFSNYYAFKVLDNKNNQKISILYDGEKAVIGGDTSSYSLVFSLWMAYAFRFCEENAIPVHTSAIVKESKAYLFLGESGTGKSTHTKLWQENIEGAFLLNDDSPILAVEDDKVYVYGSPWSGKTPCYKNERYELGGVVRLSQAPCNKIRLLKSIERFAAIYPSCPPALNNDPHYSKCICGILSSVIQKTSIYHLECLPNSDAAVLSSSTIIN